MARLLSPLARLHALFSGHSPAAAAFAPVDVPVICIETLTRGGPDRTPAVIALASHLQAAGRRVFVVCHGPYRAAARPLEVDPRRHDATLAGNDPLLIAAFARVWIAGDPARAVRAAAAAGAGVILLDGTRMNAARALSVIVAEAAAGFGNGRCWPAGPLRMPLATSLARADLLLTVGAPGAQAEFDRRWGARVALPRLRGQLAPLQTGMDWTDTPVLAFAGTGPPERFFATLRGLGARLIRAETLDRQQPLTPMLMARLESEARLRGAQLVTTERDALRLPPDFRGKVLTLPLRLELEDTDALDTALARLDPG